MAKRFTDTNKYKKPFIRGLQGAYKLLWDYLYHDCDHAGIWIIDFEIAQLYIGFDMPVNKSDALKYFNADEKRIIEIDGGKKWFIKSFIEFQYGILNPENRVHNSILKELQKYKLDKGLVSSLQGAMDKDKDKDLDLVKVKDKEKVKDYIDRIVEQFAEAHGDYEIVNRPKEREFAGKLLKIHKSKYPDMDSDETLKSLREYFNACVNINDTWLHDNMSLSIIINKFNEINNILKHGKYKGDNGATPEQIAAAVAKHFAIDSKQ
jgi:hypothetical protein